MRVIEGILAESKDYYLDAKKKIQEKLACLPKGSIKERNIHGLKYYYLQERQGKKMVQKYLGKNEPADLMEQISKRKLFNSELKKVNEALRILKKSKSRKHGQNS
ncbi:hypothetical protein KAW08_04515 [bacterium]|nr:hypothetical protein [bacterium]